MKTNVLGIICLLLCLTVTPDAWSESGIGEGNWQISITADRVDDGSGNKPRIFSCCLSQDQIIPIDPSEPKGCEYSALRIEGEQQMTFTRTCQWEDGKIAETTFDLTFHGNKMEGYVYTNIDDPNEGISNLTEYMTGEFQGPCSAAN